MSGPILYRWDGEAMWPTPYFRKLARERYRDGQIYQLIEQNARSTNSHKHYFAIVHDAWLNLPEDVSERWASSDELRKWALTHTEFRDVREYRAQSYAEALRVAKYLKEGHDYSRIEIDQGGKLVRQFIPHSQDYAHMNAREFQKSKEAVLDILASKLGVTVDDLKANAGRAA